MVLVFQQPQFHLREIVQYECQCKGHGNEVAIGYTNTGSEREILVENLAPNRKYSCKVRSTQSKNMTNSCLYSYLKFNDLCKINF